MSLETLYKSPARSSPVEVKILADEGGYVVAVSVMLTKMLMEESRDVAIRKAAEALRGMENECRDAADAIERSGE